MKDEKTDLSKKEKILLAASKLFLEKDFKTVSTQDIASEAGVAKGTVFHHYANKHLLALAVLEVFIDQMGSDFEQMKEQMKPAEIIVAMIHYSMDLVENSSGLTQLLYQIIADIDFLSKKPQNDIEKQIQDQILIIEGQLVSYIDDFAILFEQMGFDNPIAYSRIFIAMLDGLGLQLLLNPKPNKVELNQLTSSMIELFTQR